MVVKKYGYIARVMGVFVAEIPRKTTIVYEGARYPEFYIIYPDYAQKFLDSSGEKSAQKCVDIIFSSEQWYKIRQSFNGFEPEVQIYGLGPNLSDLKVKLSVMLDENGKQIKETDLARVSWDEVFADKNKRDKGTKETFEDMLKRQGFQPFDIFKTADQRIDEKDHITPEAIDAHKKLLNDKNATDKKRTALINKFAVAADKTVLEYQNKIFTMTDDEIEKEYRMEFGK